MCRALLTARILCFGLVWLSMLCSLAVAQPRITLFESAAELQADGTLHVSETITATMPGGGHGMFRDIPYAVKLPSGQTLRVAPTVHKVLLDGKPVPVTDTEKRPDDILRIYMRNKAQKLTAGTHVFSLSYTMQHMVGYFEKHDELNWNVTGNLWAVPVQKAQYTLTLPKHARIDKTAAWLGVRGSKNTEHIDTKRGTAGSSWGVQFTSLRPLEPGEGLTCAVSFAKGVVAPLSLAPASDESPSGADRVTVARMHRASTVALTWGLLLWAYFVLAWWKVGRDPARGVIVPLFHPPVAPASFGLPKGTPLSPAAVNYLVNATDLQPRGLAALLLSLMQRKNCAVFGDIKTGFRVQPADKDDSPYAEERAVRACVMAAGAVPLGKEGAEPIASMLRQARTLLHKGSPAAWALNRGWTVLGILLALTGVLLCVWLRFGMPEQWNTLVEAQLAIGAALFVVLPGIMVLTVYLLREGRFALALLMLMMVGGGFLSFEEYLFALIWWVETPLLTLGLLATMLAPCVFGPFMKAPSVEARRLLDACEGLALYIKTAESERFKQFNPPERTPELFTRLLPYAVALDLEDAWGEHCAEALAASQYADPNELRRHEYQFTQGGVMTALISGTAEAYSAYEASKSSAFDNEDSGGSGSGSGGGGGGGGFC